MAQVETTIDTSRLGYIRQKLGRNLPMGWELTTLGDALKWGSGGTPKRNEARYYGGAIPWLIIGDLNDGVVLDSETRITEDGLRNSSAKWVEPGSVLLAMYGSIGKLGIAGKRLTTNQAIAFTKPDPIDARYLFYFLMFTRGDLASLGKGATQKNISQTVIKAFPFVRAPQTQQARIVSEIEKQFSRLDEAVASLKRTKANLKRYKAAVLKAAVEGKLTEDWRKAHPDVEPASKLLERILAERRANGKGKGKYAKSAAPEIDNLPALPKGWVWTSLGQMFEVCIGATPSRGKAEYWNGTIPWVSSGEVAFCRIRETREHITLKGLANSSTEIHPPGTVLLGMIGEGKTRGQAAILEIAACNNQNSAAIHVSKAGIPAEYVYRYLEGHYEQNRSIGSGNNQPALNKARVQGIPLPLPPINEQRQIVAEVERRLSVIDELEATVGADLTRAERLRQSILTEAFSGRLVLQRRFRESSFTNERATVVL